jgi:hypothetical protein
MRIADPMTHHPVESTSAPFLLVVVRGDEAWVARVDDPAHVPSAPEGASYLVPEAKRWSLQGYLDAHEKRAPDTSWVLRAETIAPGRQRIELYVVGDGFSGGVYEATASTAWPLYRKSTGPGFAFVVGPLALAMNCITWGAAVSAAWVCRRLRRPRQRASTGLQSG